MTKSIVATAALCACLASCDRDSSTASDPKDSSLAPASEIAEPRPPAAIRVTEPEEFKVAEEEPGTPEAIEPTAGQRLDHAIDQTEEGLRKAAEATGRSLQKAGQTIERKADEKSR